MCIVRHKAKYHIPSLTSGSAGVNRTVLVLALLLYYWTWNLFLNIYICFSERTLNSCLKRQWLAIWLVGSLQMWKRCFIQRPPSAFVYRTGTNSHSHHSESSDQNLVFWSLPEFSEVFINPNNFISLNCLIDFNISESCTYQAAHFQGCKYQGRLALRSQTWKIYHKSFHINNVWVLNRGFFPCCHSRHKML